MIQTPYQQNIEIIKGFFRKPVVLVLSVCSFVSIGLNLLMIFLSPFNALAQKAISEYSTAYDTSQFSDGFIIGGSVSVTTILFALTFLLFYLFSKKQNNSLSAPSIMFKVLAIIELVLMIIATLLVIAALVVLGILLLVVMNASDSPVSPSQLTAMSALYIILLIVLIPTFVFILLHSIAQLQFANSIRKSLTTIYLHRKGANLYGALHIIFAVLTAVILVFEIFFVLVISVSQQIYLSPVQITGMFMQSILGIALNIITAVVAISYSSYIKNISMKFQTEAPAPQAAPSDNFAQAPVVNYQPASFDGNPYAAQTAVPQAPVREDFVQPAPVNEAPAVQEAPATEEPSVEEVIEEPVQNSEPVAEPPKAPVKEASAPSTDSGYRAVKFCTECGKPVGPDDYFCNNCGKEIIRKI